MARNMFQSETMNTASALGSQIVDLLGLIFLGSPDDTAGIDEVTVGQKERRVTCVGIDIKVINLVSIAGR
jgi:hypothetical protein